MLFLLTGAELLNFLSMGLHLYVYFVVQYKYNFFVWNADQHFHLTPIFCQFLFLECCCSTFNHLPTLPIITVWNSVDQHCDDQILLWHGCSLLKAMWPPYTKRALWTTLPFSQIQKGIRLTTSVIIKEALWLEVRDVAPKLGLVARWTYTAYYWSWWIWNTSRWGGLPSAKDDSKTYHC